MKYGYVPMYLYLMIWIGVIEAAFLIIRRVVLLCGF